MMQSLIKIRRHQSGLSLVELMVASAISLVLLAGLLQIFMANRNTYRLQEAMANVQESGRFSIDFLTKDTRMAGFNGCAKDVEPVNNLDCVKTSQDVCSGFGAYTNTDALHGYSYDGSFPADITAFGLDSSKVVQGTDILTVRRAESCPGGNIVCHNNSANPGKTCPGVSGNVNSAEYKIADNTYCNVQKNDVVLISNCQTADIHGVTNTPSGSIHVTITHGANLNKSPKLSNSYGEGSMMFKLRAQIFYIGFGASGEPALFRRILRTNSFTEEELVEGVYDMTILYGEDTDSDNVANQYRNAATVTDWERVVSARIILSVRSAQTTVTQSDATYTFNGANVTDRRLRRDFETTIAIRNRI